MQLITISSSDSLIHSIMESPYGQRVLQSSENDIDGKGVLFDISAMLLAASYEPPLYLAQSAFHLSKWTDVKQFWYITYTCSLLRLLPFCLVSFTIYFFGVYRNPQWNYPTSRALGIQKHPEYLKLILSFFSLRLLIIEFDNHFNI